MHKKKNLSLNYFDVQLLKHTFNYSGFFVTPLLDCFGYRGMHR